MSESGHVDDVGPLPEAREEADSPFLEGVVLVEDGLVGVVDVSRVFAALEPGGAA